MTFYESIVGKPNYKGEIRVIKESPIPKRRAKSVNEWFPDITIYLVASDYGTWYELKNEHEIEGLRKQGKI